MGLFLKPAKLVKRCDRQLRQARALYEGYRANMDRYDRDLAQGLLEQYVTPPFSWPTMCPDAVASPIAPEISDMASNASTFLLASGKRDCTVVEWAKLCG